MQLACTLYRCPCKHNTERSAHRKDLFRTKFGKRVLGGGTLERNVDEAYDNTTEAGSSVSAYTDSGALGVPYAFAR